MLNREMMEQMLAHRGYQKENANAQTSGNGNGGNNDTVNVQISMPGLPDWSKVGKENTVNKNRPTQKMVDAIHRIADRKSVAIDASKLLDFATAQAYMQELYAMPFPESEKRFPVSDKQKAKIAELCKECNFPEPDYSTLDGGFNGTASQLIQKLLKMSQDNKVTGQHVMLTSAQEAEIQRFQLCPAVCAYNEGKPLEQEEIERMSKGEAYQYIAKHRGDYYSWIKTRASLEQINRIEQLNEMMQNPKMGYEVLIQFDTEQASAYITQLETEYNRKDWNETSLEPEDDYFNDEVRHRFDKSEEKALRDMRAMAARLYATIGQPLEEEWLAEADMDEFKELCEFVALYVGGNTVSNIVEDNESLGADLKRYLLENVSA